MDVSPITHWYVRSCFETLPFFFFSILALKCNHMLPCFLAHFGVFATAGPFCQYWSYYDQKEGLSDVCPLANDL